MVEQESNTAREYSVAVSSHYFGNGKMVYYHACKDCGRIRESKMKRMTDLRCAPCGYAYKRAHPKRPPITCNQCGAAVKAVWRSAFKERYCSRACANEAQRSRRIDVICKHCKKPFQLPPGELYRRNRKVTCCSNACRISHHRWIECANCHKAFNARHNTTRVYCSKSCYRKSKGETSIETAVRVAFEGAGFQTIREYQPKGMRPFDLFIPALNLLVEADGDYWHSRPGVKERDARKTAKAISLGFHVERISESVITSDGWPARFSRIVSMYPVMLPLQ